MGASFSGAGAAAVFGAAEPQESQQESQHKRREQSRSHRLGFLHSQPPQAFEDSTGTLWRRLTGTSSSTHTLTRLQTVTGTHSFTV